ncbi:MAG: MFS transporter [bacterium]|nr:MFS transporter [bacterium]
MSRRWLIFIIASSLFFLSQFYRVSNAVIAPLLIQDLSLDTKTIGLISASFFYAFAITQIPISLLLDKLGPRIMMTALSMIGVIGAVIFSLADSSTVGVMGRALLGVGMACNLMGPYKLLTLWFSPRVFASLAGILVAFGSLGNMVATTPLVILVEQLGWRSGFQLIALINLILAFLFFIIVRDRPLQSIALSESAAISVNTGQALGNLRVLFKQKDYWIISLGTFGRYGVYAAFQALWAGPYLMEVIGLSVLTTGNLILLLNVGMIIGSPICGTLSDRLFETRKWVIVAGSMGIVLTIMIMAILPPGMPLFVFALLFFGFGFFNATGVLMYPHIKELMPPEMSGAAMTGINFFTMIGPAIFLQGLGTLMQTLYPAASRGPEAFQAAFMVCIACLVLITILYCFTSEKRLER